MRDNQAKEGWLVDMNTAANISQQNCRVYVFYAHVNFPVFLTLGTISVGCSATPTTNQDAVLLSCTVNGNPYSGIMFYSIGNGDFQSQSMTNIHVTHTLTIVWRFFVQNLYRAIWM